MSIRLSAANEEIRTQFENGYADWEAGKQKHRNCKQLRCFLVPRRGLEPPRLAAHGPEPCASTNSATWAGGERLHKGIAERGQWAERRFFRGDSFFSFAFTGGPQVSVNRARGCVDFQREVPNSQGFDRRDAGRRTARLDGGPIVGTARLDGGPIVDNFTLTQDTLRSTAAKGCISFSDSSIWRPCGRV